jgi:hypothetical protein
VPAEEEEEVEEVIELDNPIHKPNEQTAPFLVSSILAYRILSSDSDIEKSIV